VLQSSAQSLERINHLAHEVLVHNPAFRTSAVASESVINVLFDEFFVSRHLCIQLLRTILLSNSMQQAKAVPLPMYKRAERLMRSGDIKLVDIQDYTYTVYGSTGKLYKITTDGKFSCNCIDCKRTGQYCKHIYFIFVHVFGFTPELDKEYTLEELHGFHDNFVNRHTCSKQARNDECIICFEGDLDNCYVCSTCENGFHRSCIDTMLRFSKKCPMCRTLIFL
jgi:hypothetical protein